MKNSSPKTDVRYECVRILRAIDEQEVFARELLSERYSRGDLSGRDKGLLTELTHGVIRHRLTLDTIISAFSKIPLARIEPWILYALRVGLYQMIYLDRIPPSAAVNTAVELVKKLIRRADAVKFTNAVLRSVERSIHNKSEPASKITDPQKALYRRENTWCTFHIPIFPNPVEALSSYLAMHYSHPEWLIQRWIGRYGKENTVEICRANNRAPSLFLRINQRKIPVREFVALLDHKGIPSHTVNNAVIVDDIAVSEIPGFSEGLFFVQDVSAMKVAEFLKAENSHTVLDLCAAPGGKATHIAELLEGTGWIYALDISFNRLRLVKENCRRMGIQNVSLVCGDASSDRVPFHIQFDRVLIDAPCSNTGVLARRAEARWRLKERDIQTLASLQYSILKTGATMMKPDGYLVYSTCSIEPEENQEVIKKFIDSESQCYLDAEDYYLPGINTGDGGYMARLCKRRGHR
ncbi:MAG: 16S rRNA (cytosine(967)-C(5))-methyltransferase [Candidatus Brocadia sp. WS118]|nr:MAG: 16S rRNA (cytosine(967)-C(5))-methyltransferase [Candidatus Brocadia sp. WS118]